MAQTACAVALPLSCWSTAEASRSASSNFASWSAFTAAEADSARRALDASCWGERLELQRSGRRCSPGGWHSRTAAAARQGQPSAHETWELGPWSARQARIWRMNRRRACSKGPCGVEQSALPWQGTPWRRSTGFTFRTFTWGSGVRGCCAPSSGPPSSKISGGSTNAQGPGTWCSSRGISRKTGSAREFESWTRRWTRSGYYLRSLGSTPPPGCARPS